ncbi:MAG: hypothetical protein ABSE56_16200 [Bryobacteraceae bacterium]
MNSLALDPLVAAQRTFRLRPALEFLPSGVAPLDALTGGLPRGAITDLYGPASSGRTSLLFATPARRRYRGGAPRRAVARGLLAALPRSQPRPFPSVLQP